MHVSSYRHETYLLTKTMGVVYISWFYFPDKLTLTVFEAYDPEFENKESNRFKQVARNVAEKLHALLSDVDFTANFVITVQELE